MMDMFSMVATYMVYISIYGRYMVSNAIYHLWWQYGKYFYL